MPDVCISNTVTNETTIHIEVHLEPSYVYIIATSPPNIVYKTIENLKKKRIKMCLKTCMFWFGWENKVLFYQKFIRYLKTLHFQDLDIIMSQ